MNQYTYYLCVVLSPIMIAQTQCSESRRVSKLARTDDQRIDRGRISGFC